MSPPEPHSRMLAFLLRSAADHGDDLNQPGARHPLARALVCIGCEWERSRRSSRLPGCMRNTSTGRTACCRMSQPKPGGSLLYPFELLDGFRQNETLFYSSGEKPRPVKTPAQSIWRVRLSATRQSC